MNHIKIKVQYKKTYENLSYIELSKYYKISLSTIYDIKKYRSWKHI